MPIGATVAAAGIGAAGSIGSAYLSSKAADKAARRQESAAERARAEARADVAPFTGTGKSAVLSLAQLYGLSPTGNGPAGAPFPQSSLDAFTRSPDYQFALDQGVGALERSAAARGQLRGGNLLRDITEFGSGLATQNFGRYTSRLMDLARMGGSMIPNTSALTLAGGEAGAAGIVGQANAINSGIQGVGSAFNSGASNYLLYDMLKNPAQSSFASAGAPTSFRPGGLY